MKNVKEEQKKPFSGSLPYTQKELDEYIEETCSWVHEPPPMREKIEFIHNAVKKATEKRKEQGFQMTHKKRQMYEMGFEDAIEWVLGNEL